MQKRKEAGDGAAQSLAQSFMQLATNKHFLVLFDVWISNFLF